VVQYRLLGTNPVYLTSPFGSFYAFPYFRVLFPPLPTNVLCRFTCRSFSSYVLLYSILVTRGKWKL